MSFRHAHEQQKHVVHGERGIKVWKVREKGALHDLEDAQEQLNMHPNDAAFNAKQEKASQKYLNVQQARQRREEVLRAEKRVFGWID